MSRSSRPAPGSRRGPDREDRTARAPGRRRARRAAPRRRASRSTRVRNAASSAGETRRSARPVSVPLEPPRRRDRLAGAARAQDEHVRRAVGERGPERDRRRQPGVDEAPPVERRPAARRAAAAPPRRAAPGAALRVAANEPWRSTGSAGRGVGGDRVQLGRAGQHRRRTAPARAARSAPRPAPRTSTTGPRRSARRRRSARARARVRPRRDAVAHPPAHQPHRVQRPRRRAVGGVERAAPGRARRAPSAIPPDTAPRMPPPSTTSAIRAPGGRSRRAAATGCVNGGARTRS